MPNKVADHLQLKTVRKKVRQTSDRCFSRTRLSLSGVAQPRGNGVPLRRLQKDSCYVCMCVVRTLSALCAHHSLTQYTLPTGYGMYLGMAWFRMGIGMLSYGMAWYGSSVALSRLTTFSDLTACHVSHIHHYLKLRAVWLPAYPYPRTVLNGHMLTAKLVLRCIIPLYTLRLSFMVLFKTGQSILSQYLKKLTLA